MVAAPPPADADVVLFSGPRGKELRAVVREAQAEAARRGIEINVPEDAGPAVRGDLFPLFFEGLIWDEPALARSRPALCVLPWCKLRVDFRGRVFPCQMIQDPALAWGNILTGDFADVINSEGAVRMRSDMLAGKAPNAVCARCPVGPSARRRPV